MELRRILMGLYLLAFPAMMWGQTPVVPGTADEEHSGHRKETPVNFGFKGGFTSSLFLVSQFSVNGVPIDEVQNNYKIGYFGSLFMRINFDRHFLQPEISYNINRCNITFEKPAAEDAPLEMATSPSRNLCPKTPHQEPGWRKPPLHRPSTV